MINRLIKLSLENRFLTIILFVITCGAGIFTIYKTPVDALPDLSENQVIVMTQWPGQNPKNIEDQITYPLTVSMQGLAGVRDIRAMSQFGVSMVTIIFEDDIDIYFARDRVSERLSLARSQLPPGITPILGPDATGLGQIFMYTLESDDHDLTELRSIQDFTVRYALQSVEGVAEVASVGGYMKTYQVVIEPLKLHQYGLSLMDVMNAIAMGNNNVSGQVIEAGDREVAIQGIGFFETTADIGNIVLGKTNDNIPLTVADVAQVRISGMPRRGILADAEEEKVGGIVVMRYGENPLAVIDAVKEKIKILNKSLPDSVSIQSFYDRTSLITAAINTLKDVLTQELIITTIILGLFLWHFGSTIITAISLLVGVILTFLFMYIVGIPSNIMSLGGIAIAIGTMVDSAIVISENAYRKLMKHKPKNVIERIKLVKDASLEVGKPIVFAIFIIILSFLPIFSLEGMEGKLFAPLAFTNTFAMLGALIAALFLVPTLSTFFLKGNLKDDHEIAIVRWLQTIYKPILLTALKFRKITLSITVALVVIGGLAMTQIGSEFMPPLDEGSIMYMPMTVPDVSEKKVTELLIETNQILSEFPEVESVVGKAGRAQTATDPAPLAMLETFVMLKPKEEWRDGMTKQQLISQMNRGIKIPNLWNGFTQPIIGRIDMLSTGIRAQIGIKVFGDDPIRLEEIAVEIENLMGDIPGAVGITAIRTTGLKYLDIKLRDDLLAQYDIPKKDALLAIQAGVGGARVTKTIQGRESYGVEVRLKQGYRQDIEDIQSLPIASKYGSRILLSSIADIKMNDGPAVINSENGIMRAATQMNIMGRDLVSFVEDGKNHLEENLKLPDGYYTEWSGQYQNQLRAKQRLSWIVPIVILLIFLLLYLTYKDLSLVSIVILAIPLSLVGGVIALFIADYNFSVAVWVGFIALFGNAVETGMVIIVYLENAFRRKFGLPLIEGEEENPHSKPQKIHKNGIHEAVLEGAMLRLRPILMTAFTSVIGLIPMVATTGVGAEVQKPLALVVMSGLTTSVMLTLIVIPVLFTYLRERQINFSKE